MFSFPWKFEISQAFVIAKIVQTFAKIFAKILPASSRICLCLTRIFAKATYMGTNIFKNIFAKNKYFHENFCENLPKSHVINYLHKNCICVSHVGDKLCLFVIIKGKVTFANFREIFCQDCLENRLRYGVYILLLHVHCTLCIAHIPTSKNTNIQFNFCQF